MALIAVAADKGAPGVTTASVALAAVWPRPVLLAECDPAGGDVVYRLPGADGTRLDPRRGLLSLAVAARRGLLPHQVWEHTQKLHGGLDVLAGVTSAEQGAGLEALWDMVGGLLSRIPQADVIADCGRIGRDGPFYDLLAEAEAVVLITRASLAEVVRLRDRATALANGLQKRGRPGARVGVVVVADHKTFRTALAEVRQAIGADRSPASVIGGLAYEPKSADQLRGQWGGKLDKSLLIRTAREIAGHLAAQLADAQLPDAAGPAPQRAASGGPAPLRSASQEPAPPRSAGWEPALLPSAAEESAPQRTTAREESSPGRTTASEPRTGRHIGPQAAAEGEAGREVPDHLGPLSGPPSATVSGGPVSGSRGARPGDPGGW
jgi:hypothetical protein